MRPPATRSRSARCVRISFQLRVPPLRERRDDTELLARHFLAQFRSALDKWVDGFMDECEGNERRAADVLGIVRRTLYRDLES